MNGRVDLSQAENIEKLISARSVAAADAALAGLQVTPFCLQKGFLRCSFSPIPDYSVVYIELYQISI